MPTVFLPLSIARSFSDGEGDSGPKAVVERSETALVGGEVPVVAAQIVTLQHP